MSSTANMPIAMPKSVSARSTCSGVAPSSTRNCASYMYGNIMRLPTKPGAVARRRRRPCRDALRAPSPSRATVRRRSPCRARSRRSRITFAGLKKCRPTTALRPRRRRRDRVDVERRRVRREDARPASRRDRASAKICFLSAMFSKTASMIEVGVAEALVARLRRECAPAARSTCLGCEAPAFHRRRRSCVRMRGEPGVEPLGASRRSAARECRRSRTPSQSRRPSSRRRRSPTLETVATEVSFGDARHLRDTPRSAKKA